MTNATSKQQQIGLTIIRVIVGLVFVVHGWQKFAELGHAGVTGFFSQLNIPLPALTAWVVMLLELVGGFALMVGFLTRYVALALAFNMIGAIVTVHLKNGFFMQTGGYEFALTLLAASTALVFAGHGAGAVDSLIEGRRKHATI